MPSTTRRACFIAAGALLAPLPARSQTRNTAPAFDTERFIADVRRAVAENEPQAGVEDIVRRSVGSPAALLRTLGEPATAGIHTLYRGTDVTILNVVWAPLMVLLPHNHNAWATIGIYSGREDNILWRRRGPIVEAAGAASLQTRQVLSLGSDAIHSVVNPIRRLTGALHVYGGDFFAPGRSEWDAESLRERPWDLAAAQDEFREAASRFEQRC